MHYIIRISIKKIYNIYIRVELMTGRLARVAMDPLPQTILGRGLFSSRPKVVSASLHQVALRPFRVVKMPSCS